MYFPGLECLDAGSGIGYTARVKTTEYFKHVRRRPDRAHIRDEWIEAVLEDPTHRLTQSDGRVRLWRAIKEAEGRWLRVVLLSDGETVHNAFFDRRFRGDRP